MAIEARQADYSNQSDRRNVVRLMTEYARFECGDRARDMSRLPDELASFPNAFSVLAFDESDRHTAVGLVNCFLGYSTFEGRKLVNLHDVIVTETFRGKGVSHVLLSTVQSIARAHDCCRLTLEVDDDNLPAKRAYHKFGFRGDPNHPGVDTLFRRKAL